VIERRGLSDLFDGCTAILGHTLNATETAAIVGLIDDLSLDKGFLLTLLAYCAEEGKGSVRYMEKTAVSLFERGVTTLAALDSYILSERERKTAEGTVRRLFGIGSRPFSKSEKEKIARWKLYGYGEDVIGLAYDLTVDRTGKASLAYADKILISFYEKGLKTAEECMASVTEEAARKRHTERRTPSRGRTAESHSSFDTGDFMKRALERSYAASGAGKDETT
jgi:DNA replication protein DnaD